MNVCACVRVDQDTLEELEGDYVEGVNPSLELRRVVDQQTELVLTIESMLRECERFLLGVSLSSFMDRIPVLSVLHSL